LKRFVVIIFIILIVIFSYVGYPYYKLYKAKNLDNVLIKEDKIIVFKNDILFSEIGIVLDSLNVIKDADAFNILIDYKKFSLDTLKKGKYKIKAIWDHNKMINQLHLMRNQALVDLTVLSTSNFEKLCENISNSTNIDSLTLMKVLHNPKIHAKYGFNKEQFMTMFIPNTFEIYSSINETEFIQLMANHYKIFWNNSRKQKAKEIGLSQSEIYILASIVQMEQQVNIDEHPKIAGLYINRLKINKELQADPTVKFANNLPKLGRVLFKHLEFDSPYNTYMYKGLPPGPICIPDPSSIDAVLNYEKHDYIFMCAQPKSNGYHNFAVDYNDHLKNKRDYTNWLDKIKSSKNG
tara:strand:+ start:4070 stop:5119 length:1050 start_codon:yes stop_codon:yes gene_type:complete